MPRKFRDKRTAQFAAGMRVRAFSGFERQADKRLTALMAAETLNDLRVNRGNRQEQLSGDRNGQWSIRINDQWRICFEGTEDTIDPTEIEIVDYH
ncbi:MAG TPA: type II toxin-antitoxin system RelE/ParE family toxin [Thermomicrobiales bacterium]|nr:type II toxin-antitoxin system RelE/ParE family toxin [Thermomicrobiales bacterium]